MSDDITGSAIEQNVQYVNGTHFPSESAYETLSEQAPDNLTQEDAEKEYSFVELLDQVDRFKDLINRVEDLKLLAEGWPGEGSLLKYRYNFECRLPWDILFEAISQIRTYMHELSVQENNKYQEKK